jgi:hypothetical protein
VVLLDPPFRLIRERLAKVLRQIWMFTGCLPYQGRICAINPAIRVGARTHAGGHTMLADDPCGVIAKVTRFPRPEAPAG